MRSFHLVYLIIFAGLYLITGLGAYLNLIRIICNKKFKISYWCCSISFILFLFFLYAYQDQPKEATNYLYFFYFNALLFTDLIVKITLSVFFVLSLPVQKKKVVSYMGVIMASSIGAVMLYGLLLGRNEIKISRQELEFNSLPSAFDNFKIVQISDSHLGSFRKSNKMLTRVKDKIRRIDPDLVLFTGDLVNNYAEETKGWTDIFNQLNSGGKSFSILGNHDYGDYSTWENKEKKAANFEKIVMANKRMGFKLLRNENRVIHRGKDSIFIVGVENWGLPPFPQHANLEKASVGIPQNAFKILMTHDPAHWETAIKETGNYQLTLSGHTHGMQWGIKAAGIPFSLAWLIEKKWGGLYRYGDTFLYVNTGLGSVGIPWRIDMPAEITVITLTNKKS